MKHILFFILFLMSALHGQDRFLQKVDYQMELEFDLKKHQYDGDQVLKYTNNSKDTLYRVFYHLYFNAFKPESVMDVGSRNSKDPDRRVGDRIKYLKKSEQGFIQVKSLTMDGKKAQFKEEGTILEVVLPKPILPGKTVELEMEFLAQIPLQVRRTGRNNAEGIEYSVAQGYPKMCGYDEQGWHANPYIAREFYGPFGKFDVTIEMPSNYIVAATGVLQNPDEVGCGYSEKEPSKKDKKLEWRFIAENVHDFVWAADPDFKHISYKAYDGTILRFFYQENEKTKDNWENFPKAMDAALAYLNTNYGKYPYPEYSFIQGGDGGMEYPMATLITGERSYISLVGVGIHELAHSWYQGVIATNESLYHWMDEGFANYIGAEALNHLRKLKMVPGLPEDNPQLSAVKGYVNFTKTGLEEALITHADHFATNAAYGAASYTKGQTLLEQLRYIIGDDAFKKGMKRYYDEWKFKHPNANDFFRVMEKTSGIELDWFKEYFVHSTHTADYALVKYGFESVVIERVGRMPMPLDITVTFLDGKVKKYYIPIDLMRESKKEDKYFNDFEIVKRWPWVNKFYTLNIGVSTIDIKSIEIDASGRMADVNRSDNHFPRLSMAPEDISE